MEGILSAGNESEEMIRHYGLQFGSALVITWAINSYLGFTLTKLRYGIMPFAW